MSDAIDWDAIERSLAWGRVPRCYMRRACPRCGRVISESAYSGRCGNFKKHVQAHARADARAAAAEEESDDGLPA